MKNSRNSADGNVLPKIKPEYVFQALASILAPLMHKPATTDLVAQTDIPKALRRPFLEAVRSGELPGSKVGRAVVVERAAFDAWLASHRVHAKKLEAPSAPADDADEIAARLGFTAVRG